MTVWYCNHYAMPQEAGGAVRPIRLAEGVHDGGGEVLVVAAGWHHLYREAPVGAPEPGENRISQSGGIRFLYLGARPYSGNGLGRVRNMLDYAAGLKRLGGLVASGELNRPDVIVYSTPHPFGAGAASRVAKTLGARFLVEVRDLWPESLIEIAGLSRWHPLSLWAGRCVQKAYREADAVIGVLPGVGRRLGELGFGKKEFAYIPNGAALGEPGKAEGKNPYEKEFAVARAEGKFIVVYTGSLGVANDLDQILNLVAVAGEPEPNYHFFLIGDGNLRGHLERRVDEEGIKFVTILPPVPKSAIPAILKGADAGVVIWKKRNLYRYGVSPNKVFDYLLAGIPVLWVGETEPDPIHVAEAGWTVPPEDSKALHDALVAAAATGEEQRAEKGSRGASYLTKHHNWANLSRKFFEFCKLKN